MSRALILDAVPSELLIAIVLCADQNSIRALSLTCRIFHDLITNSTAVQLHIELAAQGLFLNTHLRPRHSSAEWYNRLIQVRDNWLGLKFASLPPLKLAMEDNEMLSVVQGGVFACGARTPGRFDGINRVKVARLPSLGSLPGSQKDFTYTTTTITTGRYLSAFRTSAEQDLLVLGALTHSGPTLTIHTLSGGPHPLAKKATLGIVSERFLGFAVHDPQPIQIYGDLVSALLCSGRIGPNPIDWEIAVWNWKTGDVVFRKQGTSHATSFTFLSSDSYLFAERVGDSSHLLIGNLDTSANLPTPTLKLKLPELSTAWNFGPLHFTSQHLSSHYDSNEHGQAFLSDPQAGIICLQVGLSKPLSTPGEHIPHLGLFIDRGALIQKKHAIDLPGCEILELDWEQWGEDATRWIDMGKMPGLLATAHGSRYVQVVRQERAPKGWLQVLEFSPSAVRRDQACEGDDTSELRHSDPVQIHEHSRSCERLGDALANLDTRASVGSVMVERFGRDRPTVLDIPGAFLRRVVSKLPYRCATQIEPVDATSEWMMDGDLLLRVDEPEEGAECCMVYPHQILDRSITN